MITQADQKIGKDAYDRYADLVKELPAIEAQLKKTVVDGVRRRLAIVADRRGRHVRLRQDITLTATSAFSSTFPRSARSSTRHGG